MDTAFEQQQDLVEPFRLQAGSFTILVVTYEDINNPDFIPWLEKKADASPFFLKDAPVVIDLAGAPGDIEEEITRIVTRLKVCGLVPIGVQNGSEQHYQAAAAIGLCNFPVWRTAPPQDAEPPQETDARPAPAEPEIAAGEKPGVAEAEIPSQDTKPRSLVITEPVRSGRQIYAEGGDLVILAKVGAGAELRADGHIHVYGTLRGRAFAGARGDTSARIFCRSFEAELVSIAGLWRVREDFEDEIIGRPVQIRAEEDDLIITPDG